MRHGAFVRHFAGAFSQPVIARSAPAPQCLMPTRFLKESRKFQRGLISCTASTSTATCSGSMSGDMPWPRLNTWPSREPRCRQRSCRARARTCARIASGDPYSTAGSRLPCSATLPACGARFGQFDQPVDADAFRAGGGQFFQIRRVALAEQDQRRARRAIAALEFARDARRGRAARIRGTSPATARRPRCRTPAAPARRPRAARRGRRSRHRC